MQAQAQPVAPRLKIRAPPNRTVENSECNRLRLFEDASGTSARTRCATRQASFLRDLKENRRCGGIPTSKGRDSMFLDCESHVNPAKTSCSCWKRLSNALLRRMALLENGARWRRTPPLHHLHGHDERVSGYRQTSSMRRTKPPERRNHQMFIMRHVSGQDFVSASVQVQSIIGGSVSSGQ